VRIARRVPQLLGDELLELLGDVVLEDLGLVVDPVPRNPQRLSQIELEQAVVAQDLEGYPPPLLRQLDTAVGNVLDQVEPVQLLHHGGGGRCRHAEPLREGIVRNGAPGLGLERVDRLCVVLDRCRD
jgi:hypothetical protein